VESDSNRGHSCDGALRGPGGPGKGPQEGSRKGTAQERALKAKEGAVRVSEKGEKNKKESK